VDIGMAMTRELCVDTAILERLEDDTLRDAFGDKLSSEALVAAANRPKKKNPAADFDRLSRAVRLTLALHARTYEALRAYRLGVVVEEAERAERRAAHKATALREAEVPVPASRKTRQEARTERLRDAVIEAAEYEIGDRESFGDLELALAERLADDEAYLRLLDLPFEETVRRICEDLDLNPDWSRWTGEGWAPRDPVPRPRGPWFKKPPRASPDYATLRAARLQGHRPQMA